MNQSGAIVLVTSTVLGVGAFIASLLAMPGESQRGTPTALRPRVDGHVALLRQHLASGNHNLLIEVGRRFLEHTSDQPDTLMFMAVAMEREGHARAAAASWERLREAMEARGVTDTHDDFWQLLMLGHALSNTGEPARARAVWLRAADICARTEQSRGALRPYNVGNLYALAGETDRAFAWLDRAVQAGYRDPRWLVADPDLEGIRDDPRFEALLERLSAPDEGTGGQPPDGSDEP